MKKVLLFLFGVIASLSAMAGTGNYFISGNFNNWNHADLQFEQQGTTYTITLDGTGLKPFSGEFLICGGTKGKPDWNDKIGGVSNIEAGQTYTYSDGGGNCSIKGVIAYPVTVTFNTADKTLIVTGGIGENDYTTVYVVGDFGDAWDEDRTDSPLTLKSGTTNVWEGDITFTGTKNYFKLKAGAYVYGTGGADIEVELGDSYTISQSGNAFQLAAGTYHFNLLLDKNADTGTLTVTSEGDDPNPPTPGDYTGWYFNLGTNSFMDENNEGYWGDGVAIPEDGIVEYGEVELGTDKFQIKIWTGAKDLYYKTSTGTIKADTPTILSEGQGEMVVSNALPGSKYDVKWNMNTCTLTMTYTGGGQEEDDFTGWYVNIGWEHEGYWKGAPVNAETGIAEFSELKLGENPIKVKVYTGTTDIFYTTESGSITPGEPTTLTTTTEQALPMTVSGAVAGDVYKAEYDCKTNTLTLTFVENRDEPDEPKEIYLVGELNAWTATEEYKLTRVDNVYTIELPEGFSGEWKFNQGDWEWNLGATAADITPSNNEEYDLQVDGKNFVANYSKAKLTVTNNDGAYTLKVDVETGVTNINAEIEGTAAYYNLQGQRVDNPVNGIYVRVLNGNAEKVMK